MEYDDEALTEIALLGDVLAAAAFAGARIPVGDLDEVLQVDARDGSAGRPAQRLRCAGQAV